MPDISVGREVVRYFKWNILAAGLKHLAGLAGVVIVARYVPPSDYGTVALVMGCMVFFSLFGEFGLSQALVGLPSVDKKLTDTIMTLSLLMAAALYLILLGVSPLLADFYRAPPLAVLLPVAGINAFLFLGMTLPIALLQRKLDFQGQAMATSVSAIVSLSFSVILAMAGYGVWALIVPSLLGMFVGGLVAMKRSGYWPHPAWDVKRLGGTLNFGFSALVANFANYLCANAVPLVMGRLWTMETLGYFSFAYSKHSKVFDAFSQQFSGGVFPVLSRVAHDKVKIRQVFFRMTRFGVAVIAPLYGALLFLAPVFFPLLLGHRWDGAIRSFQIFCLIPLLRGCMMCVNPVLYAMGLPQVSARVVVWKVGFYVFGVGICYLRDFTILTVTSVVVGIDLLFIGLYVAVSAKHLEFSLKDFAALVRKPFAMVLSLSLASVLAVNILPVRDVPIPVLWTIVAGLALGVYFLSDRRYFLDEWRTVKGHV